MTSADSEPEPDVSIVKGQPSDSRHAHPSTAALVVEIAVASLAMDREEAGVDASAAIPHYWLVNTREETIEVHTAPEPEGDRQRDVCADTVISPFGQDIGLRECFDEHRE